MPETLGDFRQSAREISKSQNESMHCFLDQSQCCRVAQRISRECLPRLQEEGLLLQLLNLLKQMPRLRRT